MHDLDETDLEILELLMSDARRPWRDIAEIVDLSAPAVSDRVARLQEMGILRRFTLDVDRSQLREGVPVLLSLTMGADGRDAVHSALLNPTQSSISLRPQRTISSVMRVSSTVMSRRGCRRRSI